MSGSDRARIDSPAESERVARALFQRVLAGWAGDLMGLRRDGLDRPMPRHPRRVLAIPGWTSGHGAGGVWSTAGGPRRAG